ncbi:MAG: formylglycine-generating enzyme family protein [Bacteroidota bacterium]
MKTSLIIFSFLFFLLIAEAKRPPNMAALDSKIFIQKTEVSNAHYQEYLENIEEKYGLDSEEYKTAFPDTGVWKHVNKPYVSIYFQEEAYSNYPVVGISYEQAKDFCEWLGQENDPDGQYHFRLPTKKEWEKLAGIPLVKIKRRHRDRRKFNFNEPHMALDEQNDDYYHLTAPVDAYWPNKIGVYHVFGNIAEMVQNKGIAKGGSWKQKKDESMNMLDMLYTRPAPWLGFRCACEKKQ